MASNKKYFNGVSLETPVIKVFQGYVENKRGCKSFLQKRANKQAPIDFLGRFYDKETNTTITDVAVEVRTLNLSKQEIEDGFGYVIFPMSKLNELMMFWRMKKEVYVVYSFKNSVYFLNWDFYLWNNFEIIKTKGNSMAIKLPIQNFKYCGDIKN